MAKFGEEENVEETEYESGSEELEFGVAMRRRRNASDDDDDDDGDGEGEEGEKIGRSNRRFGVGYGDESDCLGGYDEDEEASFEDELGDEEVSVFEEEEEENEFDKSQYEERSCSKEVTAEAKVKQGKEAKEWKPPANPRNGAFYMHDDRFIGRGSGHRRWIIHERFQELKDKQRWKHDKFEEIKLQEAQDKKFNAFVEVRRNSEQYRQGYHKNQGRGRGYVKHQNYSPKIFRGRGPIKYKPNMGGSSINWPAGNNQFKKHQDETSNTDSARVFPTKSEQYSKPRLRMTSSTEPARTFSRKKSGKFEEVISNTGPLAFEKHALPVNMGSALQMFNSSGFINHHNSVAQRKDVQRGRTFGYFPTSALPYRKILVAQCNSLLRGNIEANRIERDKLYDEKVIHPASENYLTNLPLQSSTSWLTYMIASPQLTGSSDLSLTVPTHQLSPTSTLVSGLYPRAKHPFVQQMPLEGTIQPPLRVSTQQLSPCPGSGISQTSEGSSFPNFYESETLEPLPKLSESKVAFGGKRISALQGSERGSILSNETQSDHNFTASASLFPALQPGSQHNGDLHNLAVNAAISGNISSSQNGFGKPEITWLPLFPQAGGPVGAAYLSPYVTADGRYNAHSTENLSSRRVTRYSRMNINQQTE